MSTRLPHIILLALAAAYGSGCANTEGTVRFRTYRTEIRRVTPSGHVVLESGDEFRLAGVRMRSVDETQEPELLDVINKIVVRERHRVRVEHDAESDTVVVYYKQRVNILPGYIIPITMFKRALKPTAMGTVNELLIVMAAAKFDPTVGGMTDNAARRCEIAGDKAENAFWWRNRYRPLHEYKSGPGQLYTDLHGYRARITSGDVPTRDRNIAGRRPSSAD